MLAVKSPQGTLELPAYVSPTLHPGAVAIPIGHRYAPYQHPPVRRRRPALTESDDDPAGGDRRDLRARSRS